MASDLQDLVDKWFDLVRQQGTLSLNFGKDVLDTLQGLASSRRSTLRFRIATNLVGDSGDQNNPPIRLSNVALGNIKAIVGFHNMANNSINGTRLIVQEVPPNSENFRFSLKDVGLDAPPVGKYFGPVVNTATSEVIADVIIEVF